jgi:predicted metal-dependent phosphoesterase TrpH
MDVSFPEFLFPLKSLTLKSQWPTPASFHLDLMERPNIQIDTFHVKTGPLGAGAVKNLKIERNGLSRVKIDLHIHSTDCSDGKMTLPEIFEEAHRRNIRVISVTDHDAIDCQESCELLAARYGMHYITGVELNISFSHPRYGNGKSISLDVLGYQYDAQDQALGEKLKALREYRRKRAQEILQNINQELSREGRALFTSEDLEAIAATVDGAFGRPHIAGYMVKKGSVGTRQEAFDRYLVRCNVPKMPVSLEEASGLIRGAGGRLMLAHPNDPRGTSLAGFTPSMAEQHQIIRDSMLAHLDGMECWHSRHNAETTAAYLSFSRKEDLMVTGGSDCHQWPVIMGSVDVPLDVAGQFGIELEGP